VLENLDILNEKFSFKGEISLWGFQHKYFRKRGPIAVLGTYDK